MGVRSGERAGYSMVGYPFVQYMCLEKLHRGELVHRDGSGEVLHLAESNSRRHYQTSLKFIDRQTPEAVKVSTFFRHPVYSSFTN